MEKYLPPKRFLLQSTEARSYVEAVAAITLVLTWFLFTQGLKHHQTKGPPYKYRLVGV